MQSKRLQKQLAWVLALCVVMVSIAGVWAYRIADEAGDLDDAAGHVEISLFLLKGLIAAPAKAKPQ